MCVRADEAVADYFEKLDLVEGGSLSVQATTNI